MGIVPAQAIDQIAHAARAEHYDLASLARAGGRSPATSPCPLVEALTAEVAKADAIAARYVHWGATSQDVIDTALVLDLRAAIDALIADLNRAIEGFTALAGRHRRTATVAQDMLQHAVPMPFGLKVAGYAAALGALARAAAQAAPRGSGAAVRRRRRHAWPRSMRRDLEVAERLAALLDLPLPEAPWHGHRDRLAEVASALRDPDRHLRQDRARHFAPHADGSGGSL